MNRYVDFLQKSYSMKNIYLQESGEDMGRYWAVIRRTTHGKDAWGTQNIRSHMDTGALNDSRKLTSVG